MTAWTNRGRRQTKIGEQTMLSTRASSGSPRTIAVAMIVLVAVILLVFPCPPWSLKVVIAQRTQCQANLKEIHQALRNRGVLLDATNAEQIREVLKVLILTCPEGTGIRGLPALYTCQVEDGSCMITEDRGNHPARMPIMAGSVDEKRFGIEAGGKILHFR